MKRSASLDSRRVLAHPGIALLAASALGLAAAGCGGSSGKTVASRPTTSAPVAASTQTAPAAHHRHHRHQPASPPPGARRHHRYGKGHGPQPAQLGPVLTSAGLVRKANSTCAAANSAQSAVAKPSDFNTNSKAAAAYLNKLGSLNRSELSALHLNPPPKMRATYIRFFGNLLREQLQLVVAANEAASGRSSYVQAYQSAVSYQRSEVAPLARQLGLTSCAA